MAIKFSKGAFPSPQSLLFYLVLIKRDKDWIIGLMRKIEWNDFPKITNKPMMIVMIMIMVMVMMMLTARK